MPKQQAGFAVQYGGHRAYVGTRGLGCCWSGRALPGAFITPQVAASTPVSRQRAARLVREQAQAYARGEPLQNVISGAYQPPLS